MQLSKLADIGDFRKLNRMSVESIIQHTSTIDLMDVGIKDLNTLGRTLVKLLGQARRASSEVDSWADILSDGFVLAYSVLDCLSARVDEATIGERASTMTWLADLSKLAEAEAAIDAAQEPTFELSDEEFTQLRAIATI